MRESYSQFFGVAAGLHISDWTWTPAINSRHPEQYLKNLHLEVWDMWLNSVAISAITDENGKLCVLLDKTKDPINHAKSNQAIDVQVLVLPADSYVTFWADRMAFPSNKAVGPPNRFEIAESEAPVSRLKI
jgi:hypothetical protein